MEYEATCFLSLSLGFACVEPVRDRILFPARRSGSTLPRHAYGIVSSHLPQATYRVGRSVSLPHNLGSPASDQYYVGVWPLPVRAIVENLFSAAAW